MAQQVRIEITCDPCKADGIYNVEAETLPPVTVGHGKGVKPRVLDMCERHRKELYDPLAELLERDGRNEDGSRRRRKPAPVQAEPEPEPELPEPQRTHVESHICPTCSRSDFKTDASMRQHSTRVHGIKLEPADAQGTLENMCPDCDEGPYKNLGAHRARAHGYRIGDDS